MENKVKEFHKKHNLPINESFDPEHFDRRIIADCATTLRVYCEKLEPHIRDSTPLFRVWKTFEELAEMLEGMAEGDRVKMMDGLGDSMYVMVGTGVTFGFPVMEIFNEIHKSNMTKNYLGVDKGPDYVAPDLGKFNA